MARIGMVGIGLMGHGIASNLVRKGHALAILAHPGNQPVDDLMAAGAIVHTVSAELAAQAEVVILVLTGAPQVESVLTGEDGILAGLKPGSVVIDCSTSLPGTSLKMAAAVAAAGSRFLDAPMTRTPREAAEGRLNLLVGGDADLLDRVRPILACFAENVLHCGAVSSGHSMKLLHNYVSLGTVTLIAEAAACAAAHGVAPEVFVDVLARGGGGGVALDRLKPFLLSGDTGGLRFSIANACKDLGYYQAMAGESGAERAVADAVLATLEGARARAPGAWVPELVALLQQTRR